MLSNPITRASDLLGKLPVNHSKAAHFRELDLHTVSDTIHRTGDVVTGLAHEYFSTVSGQTYGNKIKGPFCEVKSQNDKLERVYEAAKDLFISAHEKTPQNMVPHIDTYDLDALRKAEAGVGTLGLLKNANAFDKIDLENAAIEKNMSRSHIGDKFSRFSAKDSEGNELPPLDWRMSSPPLNPHPLEDITKGADFTHVDLTDTKIVNANLEKADLNNAFLDGASFTNANLDGSNLSYLHGQQLQIKDSSMKGANLNGARLSNAKIKKTPVTGSNFTDAQMDGIRISESEFTGTAFPHANLNKATLKGEGGQDLDFRMANLQDAVVDLSSAPSNYYSAYGPKHYIDFHKANLEGAKLDLSNAKDAIISLKNTKGLPQYVEVKVGSTCEQSVVMTNSDVEKSPKSIIKRRYSGPGV